MKRQVLALVLLALLQASCDSASLGGSDSGATNQAQVEPESPPTEENESPVDEVDETTTPNPDNNQTGEHTPTATPIHNPRLYGHIYWENGLPVPGNRRPSSWHSSEAADNPDLVVQTGYYHWRLAADELALTAYQAAQGTSYVGALHQNPTAESSAELTLTAYKGNVAYIARAAKVADDHLQVRLIENGQYIQRFDHTGVVFTDDEGNELNDDGYFEVTAWPDRVVYTLDFSASDQIDRLAIAVTSADGETHRIDDTTGSVSIAISPHDHSRLARLNVDDYIQSASDDSTQAPVNVEFDESLQALRFDLAPARISYPEHLQRYDSMTFTLSNPTDVAINIPLVFNQQPVPAVTGTSMVLVDADRGNPTGVPVQISKNWHRVANTPTKHDASDGNWLRGSTMITLGPNETRTLSLRTVYGYWDSAGAVSHASLSLIGWRLDGNTWKWDESALGAWGETATYDPTQHLGGAFIDDIRPTWTVPRNGSSADHGWTENVGGGDFLVYFDNDNNYRWGKQLKTAYRRTGPNVTEVIYAGITDDEKLRFTYNTMLLRSNDYNRRLYSYRYEVLEDIVAPKRFVYMQMAGDWYFYEGYDDFYSMDSNGTVKRTSPDHGGNAYTVEPFRFNDNWLAVDDHFTGSAPDVANASRGLIWLSSTLNGQSQDVSIHPYGRTWGSSTTLFDLSSSSVTASYSAGDVIEGTVMQLLPADSTEVYWGADEDFRARLANQTEIWAAVQNEYQYNVKMQIDTVIGEFAGNYPITINALANTEGTLAEFVVPGGYGIGHLPIILQNATAGLALSAEIMINDGEWMPAATLSESTDNHAYYQGTYNDDGSTDYAFNIARPTGTFSTDMRIRIRVAE